MRSELAPVVIEAAGTESALATAVNLAAKGGVVGIPLPTGIQQSCRHVYGDEGGSLVPSITYGNTQGQRDFELAAKFLLRPLNCQGH